MKKIDVLILTVLIIGLIWGIGVDRQQREIADKLIRLHVVANSDSDVDQRIKLSVRDAVLSEIAPALANVKTRDRAETILRDELDSITRAADDELACLGSNDTAVVTLTDEAFPTRYYDTFTLPAGHYMSLRVTIGAGKGHNWWCVVFPPLCEASAVEDAAQAVFSPDEVEFITEQDGGTVIKFKTLEIIAQIKEWFALRRE